MKSRHLGTYGLRAGWSGTVDADKLSYCRRCYKKACKDVMNENYKGEGRQCSQCCQWKFEGTGEVFRHRTVPGDYPTSDKWDSGYENYLIGRFIPENYIIGVKLNFKWMRYAVMAAMHNVMVNKGRRKGRMETYLQTC